MQFNNDWMRVKLVMIFATRMCKDVYYFGSKINIS